MKDITLKLSGLHCTSCALNIDTMLEEMPGIVTSNTNYAKSESHITFDPKTVSEKKIAFEIEYLGYKVEKN